MANFYVSMTIKSDGTSDVLTHRDEPRLDWIQGQVGGYIELIPFFNNMEGSACIAYCNEEGKILGLPRNDEATNFWINALRAQDSDLPENEFLVGDVVVIFAKEISNA